MLERKKQDKLHGTRARPGGAFPDSVSGRAGLAAAPADSWSHTSPRRVHSSPREARSSLPAPPKHRGPAVLGTPRPPAAPPPGPSLGLRVTGAASPPPSGAPTPRPSPPHLPAASEIPRPPPPDSHPLPGATPSTCAPRTRGGSRKVQRGLEAHGRRAHQPSDAGSPLPRTPHKQPPTPVPTSTPSGPAPPPLHHTRATPGLQSTRSPEGLLPSHPSAAAAGNTPRLHAAM